MTETSEPVGPAHPAPTASGSKGIGPRLSTLWRDMPLRGRVAVGAAALAVISLAVWLIFFSRPPAPVLQTEAARIGDVEISVLATGTLQPFLQIDVGSRASGAVVALKVDAGDEVKAGDVIAEIDSSTQTNNLATTRAALTDVTAQQRGDRAALDAAQLAYDRAAGLAAAEAGPVVDVEASLRALKTARAVLTSVAAQIDQARIAVRTAQINLAYTRIVAPFAGTVLAVTTRQGQTVNAAQSAPTIVTLGQLDRMTIDAEIAEADVINVRPGMAVYFTILGDPDHPVSGHLRSIAPAPTAYVSAAGAIAAAASSTAAAVYYNGVFDVDNPGRRLRTTMTANVSIILKAARKVLTISSTALAPPSADGGQRVRVVDPRGRLSVRRVRTGLNDGTRVEIRSGLASGERVVVGEASAAPTKPAEATPAARPRGMPRTVGGL